MEQDEARKCDICCDLFLPTKKNQILCVKCQRTYKKAVHKKGTTQNKKPKETVIEVAYQAKQLGMSYGQYVAMRGEK